MTDWPNHPYELYHHVYRIQLKGDHDQPSKKETYSVDIRGARYGQYDPIMPYNKYVDDYTEDGVTRTPFGTYGHTIRKDLFLQDGFKTQEIKHALHVLATDAVGAKAKRWVRDWEIGNKTTLLDTLFKPEQESKSILWTFVHDFELYVSNVVKDLRVKMIVPTRKLLDLADEDEDPSPTDLKQRKTRALMNWISEVNPDTWKEWIQAMQNRGMIE